MAETNPNTYVSAENLKGFKARQDAYNDGRFAKKGDIATVMRFKGSCEFAELPADAQVGDTWNVTDKAGMNYAWTGTEWDELASTVEVTLESIGAAAAEHDHAAMSGATASAAGKSGFVPAPASGSQGKFLRGDGTWQEPENTTYSDMEGATASTAGTRGLVPAPAAGKQGAYLRGDGTWSVPENTTYPEATASSPGLMSAADKAKLDAVDPGASAVEPMTDAEIDALFA